MEILRIINFVTNAWTALTTENEALIDVFTIPFLVIETIVSVLLFTAILNITANKKQKALYILSVCVLGIFSNLLIPKPYGTYLNIALDVCLIMIIFDVSFFKAIIAEVLPVIVTAVFENIFAKICFLAFDLSYTDAASIPISRLFIIISVYLSTYLVYKLAKHFNFNITLLDNITQKNKMHLLINFILGFITIGTQFYLIVFYNSTLPFAIILLSTISLLAYFIISIYSLIKTTKLELTTRDLEETKLYNQSLIILHDSVRGFKHDFHNILQAIGGYIDKKDLDGLEKYYSQLVTDCQRVNNLTSLSPETINNPAIYGILASKYLRADELGIQINLEVFLNLNKINMKIYEFTRILGILMDNAIEASSECDEKIIKLEIRKDFNVNRQILIVENTYNNKDVDTDKIFEKGYTSKTDTKSQHGLGLFEVRQILKKNNNLNLFTSKDEKFFKQQLEIY